MRELRYPVIWFFAFTVVLSATGQAVNLVVVNQLSSMAVPETPIDESLVWKWKPYAFYLVNAGPSLAGGILTLYLYGSAGVWWILRSLSPQSVGKAWPVFAACLIVPLAWEVLVFSALGFPTGWSISGYLYGSLLGGGFVGAGICEEIGWRGFALPHLQRQFSALTSTVIVGLAWGLWHWPNYLINSHPYPFVALALSMPAGIVAASIYTWAYNSTGGSLFTVVVLHGTTVIRPGVLSESDSFYQIATTTLSILIVGAILCRYGPENMSPNEKSVIS